MIVLYSALIGALLYSLSLYMPLVGGIVSFFSPLPLGYVGFSRDRNYLYLCFLVTCFLIFLVGGKLSVLLYIIQYGLPFLLFFEMYFRKIDTVYSIFYVSILMILLTIFSLVAFSSFHFDVAINNVTTFLNSNFNEVLKSYKTLGVKDSEIAVISKNLKSLSVVLVRILPALMVIFYSSIFLLNLPILQKFGKLKIKDFDLKLWHTPFWIVWVFILAGFGVFFLQKSLIWWLLLNIFIITSFVFLIQGFAVTEYWFNKHNFSKVMKNLIYIFILFSQFLLVSIAVIGLFDNWFDFRKINRVGGTDESNT